MWVTTGPCKNYEFLALVFLPVFFLLELELFAFFEPFEEFADFVKDWEPPPEEAAGVGE